MRCLHAPAGSMRRPTTRGWRRRPSGWRSCEAWGMASHSSTSSSNTGDEPLEITIGAGQARIDPDKYSPGSYTLVVDGTPQSHVDLEDPDPPRFEYVRRIGHAIDTLPAGPMTALHLGGGALTLPRYVEAMRPGSRQQVVELEKDLIDLVRARAAVPARSLDPGPLRRRARGDGEASGRGSAARSTCSWSTCSAGRGSPPTSRRSSSTRRRPSSCLRGDPHGQLGRRRRPRVRARPGVDARDGVRARRGGRRSRHAQGAPIRQRGARRIARGAARRPDAAGVLGRIRCRRRSSPGAS